MPRGDFWPNWRERLAAGVRVDANGCHVWQKALTGKGYGAIYMDGKVRLAHRVAWFAKHGSWPNPNLVVDHICEVKACVNPDHLRELSNAENIQRSIPAYGSRKRRAQKAGERLGLV